MAGAKNGNFRQIISPFLKSKIAELEQKFGADSKEAFAIKWQYVKSPLEDFIRPEERRRHYESELNIEFEGRPVKGVERLYKRTILIEPSTVCAAHCRWCLRGQYPVQLLDDSDLTHACRYIGSPALRSDLDEVLITGGDPLMVPTMLRHTFNQLRASAPNIKTFRIGSRMIFQAPERVNDYILETFSEFSKSHRLEIAVNVNHPLEFWPESVEAIKKLQDLGVRFYNQHPLLKGVNDNLETLVQLYDKLRENNIEAHYLFHAIPMRGMSHHRTSLKKGLRLANQVSSCGAFSGRTKPRYAVLSDIGKIVLYEGTIMDERPDEKLILLRSGFKLEDRRKWNPSWQMPEGTVVDDEGFMHTWYLDGSDETIQEIQDQFEEAGAELL